MTKSQDYRVLVYLLIEDRCDIDEVAPIDTLFCLSVNQRSLNFDQNENCSNCSISVVCLHRCFAKSANIVSKFSLFTHRLKAK